MTKLIISLVRFYQFYIGNLFKYGAVALPLPGSSCRFYPSCSEYAIESLSKHGALKGSAKALFRILKCNPWTKPGPDLPQ